MPMGGSLGGIATEPRIDDTVSWNTREGGSKTTSLFLFDKMKVEAILSEC